MEEPDPTRLFEHADHLGITLKEYLAAVFRKAHLGLKRQTHVVHLALAGDELLASLRRR